MTHETFKALNSYESEKRKKVKQLADGIIHQLTGEEAYLLINYLSYALFLSCQTVIESTLPTENESENEGQSIQLHSA